MPVKTMEHLHSTLITHTEMLVSNNGSVFTIVEFSELIKHSGIWHVKPAPYHAASNSLAKGAAQTFRVFMKKSTSGTIIAQVLHFLSQNRVIAYSTTG